MSAAFSSYFLNWRSWSISSSPRLRRSCPAVLKSSATDLNSLTSFLACSAVLRIFCNSKFKAAARSCKLPNAESVCSIACFSSSVNLFNKSVAVFIESLYLYLSIIGLLASANTLRRSAKRDFKSCSVLLSSFEYKSFLARSLAVSSSEYPPAAISLSNISLAFCTVLSSLYFSTTALVSVFLTTRFSRAYFAKTLTPSTTLSTVDSTAPQTSAKSLPKAKITSLLSLINEVILPKRSVIRGTISLAAGKSAFAKDVPNCAD